jgi:hypothetical protein
VGVQRRDKVGGDSGVSVSEGLGCVGHGVTPYTDI